MTVYVDEFQQWSPRALKNCFRDGSCHTTADTPEELHEMAQAIGLRRGWFQPHPTHPHYDLTGPRRERALQAGAVFMPAKEQARRRLGILARPFP